MFRRFWGTLLLLRSLSTSYQFFSIQAILFPLQCGLTLHLYLVINLTNSYRQSKSFCNQRHCPLPDTESFGKATTLTYSSDCLEEIFSETRSMQVR